MWPAGRGARGGGVVGRAGGGVNYYSCGAPHIANFDARRGAHFAVLSFNVSCGRYSMLNLVYELTSIIEKVLRTQRVVYHAMEYFPTSQHGLDVSIVYLRIFLQNIWLHL
ncbi:hypothetical protein JYU34_017397 [Plutella xylostella]|uniref:Uncharacterized protein n=1 Tax=Plutella xylostella TaxID=51655 RepID=A0ABQ7Q120_PLUXY|nr:hypothetical protein JYU34_017397 [Plutella xylostella]